jgi:nucleoside phosphorylase
MEAKQTGSYSMGGSADLIRFVMRNKYCFPSVIISYGICFGNDYHKQELGDTIIANKLYPYFMSAKVKEKYFFVKDSNIFDIAPQLDTKIQYLIGKGELSEKNRIFYGNMVTGEAVISNEIMKDIFIKAATNQPVLGGEMEGYGLFKECRGFECLVPCLLVKSICDWGAYKNIEEDPDADSNLKDKLQAYAAKQAYKVLSILLQKSSTIFELSIYGQIKHLIFNTSIKEEGIINRALLEKLLREDIKTSKKDMDISLLCAEILDELLKEGVIKKIKGEVYRLKEEK